MITTNKAKKLLEEVKAGVSKVVNSEGWKAWLDFNSKFWQYSFRNQVLIGFQRPEATRVAGFHKWKTLGRFVKKGEHGILILAPMLVRGKEEGSSEKELLGFRAVPVFDISQTEGKELPKLYHPLKGHAPEGVFVKARKFIQSKGYHVSFKITGEGLFGFVNSKKEIVLKLGESPAQDLNTLIHEMAHALLGHVGDEHVSRSHGELEAETAAWMVCRNLGLETGSSSFEYLASWSHGSERDRKLEEAATRGCVVAKQILEGICEEAEEAKAA